MKKILMLMLLLGSFAFGENMSIETRKSDRCVPANYSLDYQGIDSFNDGYYAHMYEYANCKIGGHYFHNVRLAIITKSSNEFTDTLSSLTFYPKKTVYYYPNENKISFNINKVVSWKH